MKAKILLVEIEQEWTAADWRVGPIDWIGHEDLRDADLVVLVRPDSSGYVLKSREGHEGPVAIGAVPTVVRGAIEAFTRSVGARLSIMDDPLAPGPAKDGH